MELKFVSLKMVYFSEPMKLLINVQYSGEKAMSHPQTESLS